MADVKTNEVIDVKEEEVKVEETTKSTEIVEIKKGFHPIKKAKEWTKNHPKATKVIVATAGFAAGVAGTLLALAKVNGDSETDDIAEGLDNDIIDGEFEVTETETTES